MPRFNSIESFVEFRCTVDPCPLIVVFWARDDPATTMAALESGAVGFISRSSTKEVMLNELRLLMANSVYVLSTVLGMIARLKYRQDSLLPSFK